MENKDKPAFPVRDPKQGTSFYYHGMTKREYFAGLAMQGLCSAHNSEGSWATDAENTAIIAVEYADELLKQLEQ